MKYIKPVMLWALNALATVHGKAQVAAGRGVRAVTHGATSLHRLPDFEQQPAGQLRADATTSTSAPMYTYITQNMSHTVKTTRRR